MSDTARDRLTAIISREMWHITDDYGLPNDYRDSASELLDALLEHRDDLAEAAGLHTFDNVYNARSGGMQAGYRAGQRETAVKIAEAIWEECGGLAGEWARGMRTAADITRSFTEETTNG